MAFKSLLLEISLALWSATRVEATGPIPMKRTGLAGINGFTFYDPYCGNACFRSFSPFELSCSVFISAGGHTTANDEAYALAVCRSTNLPYLSSIAWCIHEYCPSTVQASTIEGFWETGLTGDVNVPPRWSYGAVLSNITTPPTMVADVTMASSPPVLNETMLTTRAGFEATQDTLIYFYNETVRESNYGYVESCDL